MWTWLRDEGNARAIGIVIAIVSAIATAGWAVFTFYYDGTDYPQTAQPQLDAAAKAFIEFRRGASRIAKIHMAPVQESPCHLVVSVVNNGEVSRYQIDVKEDDLLREGSTWFIRHRDREPIVLASGDDNTPTDISALQEISGSYGALKDACIISASESAS